MKNKYKIFQFDSKNTGWYFWEGNSLIKARDMAKKFAKTRIDGLNNFFELYEKGVKTEWSI